VARIPIEHLIDAFGGSINAREVVEGSQNGSSRSGKRAAEASARVTLNRGLVPELRDTLWPGSAQPERIREVDRIPVGIPVEVESPRDADGIWLGEWSPRRTWFLQTPK
jgi:hypothetical protein